MLPCRACQLDSSCQNMRPPWLFHGPVVAGTGRRLVRAEHAPIHKYDMSVTHGGPSRVSVLDQDSTRHVWPC